MNQSSGEFGEEATETRGDEDDHEPVIRGVWRRETKDWEIQKLILFHLRFVDPNLFNVRQAAATSVPIRGHKSNIVELLVDGGGDVLHPHLLLPPLLHLQLQQAAHSGVEQAGDGGRVDEREAGDVSRRSPGGSKGGVVGGDKEVSHPAWQGARRGEGGKVKGGSK